MSCEENTGNLYIDKGLVPLIYKYVCDLSHRCIYMANQKMKICSILLVVTEEIQMKMRCYFSVYRLTTVKRFFIKYRVDNRLGKRILFSCTVNGRINWLDLHCSPCSLRQGLRFCAG